MAQELPAIGTHYDLNAKLFPAKGGQANKTYDNIRDSGIKTIHLPYLWPPILAGQAKYLEPRGMLQEDYLYVFQPNLVPTNRLDEVFQPQEPDSALDKMLNGGIVLHRVGPYNLPGREADAFWQAWVEQGPDIVQTLNDYNPLSLDHEAYYRVPADFFQTTRPFKYSSVVYDTMIALGMGACQAQAETKKGSKPSGSGGGGGGQGGRPSTISNNIGLAAGDNIKSQSGTTFQIINTDEDHPNETNKLPPPGCPQPGDPPPVGRLPPGCPLPGGFPPKNGDNRREFLNPPPGGCPKSGDPPPPGGPPTGCPLPGSSSHPPGVPSPNLLMEAILKSTFHGALGKVSFGEDHPKARDKAISFDPTILMHRGESEPIALC